MCLNCGCGDYKNTMGNERNLVVSDLVDAAIAGNDGDAKKFLDEVNKALGRITPEELQKEVEKKKEGDATQPSAQADSGSGDS